MSLILKTVTTLCHRVMTLLIAAVNFSKQTTKQKLASLAI